MRQRDVARAPEGARDVSPPLAPVESGLARCISKPDQGVRRTAHAGRASNAGRDPHGGVEAASPQSMRMQRNRNQQVRSRSRRTSRGVSGELAEQCEESGIEAARSAHRILEAVNPILHVTGEGDGCDRHRTARCCRAEAPRRSRHSGWAAAARRVHPTCCVAGAIEAPRDRRNLRRISESANLLSSRRGSADPEVPEPSGRDRPGCRRAAAGSRCWD